jgi:hypothetical protein
MYARLFCESVLFNELINLPGESNEYNYDKIVSTRLNLNPVYSQNFKST